jgi:hypothetical protein
LLRLLFTVTVVGVFVRFSCRFLRHLRLSRHEVVDRAVCSSGGVDANLREVIP